MATYVVPFQWGRFQRPKPGINHRKRCFGHRVYRQHLFFAAFIWGSLLVCGLRPGSNVMCPWGWVGIEVSKAFGVTGTRAVASIRREGTTPVSHLTFGSLGRSFPSSLRLHQGWDSRSLLPSYLSWLRQHDRTKKEKKTLTNSTVAIFQDFRVRPHIFSTISSPRATSFNNTFEIF